MDISKRFIDLSQVSYPVFKLGTEKPQREGTVLFYLKHMVEDGVDSHTISIVDDTSIDKPSLSQRRLLLMREGVPLKKIRSAVFFLGDLIKLAYSKAWFIDSSGLLFTYNKSRMTSLLCKPISKIMPMKSGGAIIEVEGIRYKTLHTPRNTSKYAGILQDGINTILYGIYEEPFKNTVRKI